MFDSPADAANALLEYFDRPRIEIIVEGLVPAVLFHRSSSAIVIGGTRFGGVPDVPEGFSWPRPPRPENIEEIAKRGNEYAAEEMRAHMARNLPYTFIAQINLAEASALGPVTSSLPAEGRLLFFYDMAIGPWETGTRVAKVIWDRSPAAELRPLNMPDDLAAAAEEEEKEFAGIATQFKRAGEEAGGGSNYGAPARAMTMRPTWRLPNPYVVEIDRLPDIAAVAHGKITDPQSKSVYETYKQALEAFGDGYADKAWQRQQLLGSPLPEQDDPRYDAVVVSEWGKQHLSRDEWKENRDAVLHKARDWVLLFQLDIGDWMQRRLVEGTVYFLIRRSDLEERKFDRVVAVYQQT